MSVESVIVLGDGSVAEITATECKNQEILDLRINAESMHAVPDIKVLISDSPDLLVRESKFLDSIRAPEQIVIDDPLLETYPNWVPVPLRPNMMNQAYYWRFHGGIVYPVDPALGARLGLCTAGGIGPFAYICKCLDGYHVYDGQKNLLSSLAIPATPWYRGGDQNYMTAQSEEGDHVVKIEYMQYRLRAYGRFFLKTRNGKVYFKVLNPYPGRADVVMIVDWDIKGRTDNTDRQGPEG